MSRSPPTEEARRPGLSTLATLVGLFLAACAAGPEGPRHPGLRQAALPPLIPIERFLEEGGRGFTHRLSPDGRQIAWVDGDEGHAEIRIRDLETDAVTRLRPGGKALGIVWAADSRHLLLSDDGDGDENYGYRIVDITDPARTVRDLLREPGVRSEIERISRCNRTEIIFRSNRRDRSVFDLVAVDIGTGAIRQVERNPGLVRWWRTDNCGVALMRGRGRVVEARAQPAADWRRVIELGRDDSFDVVSRPRVGETTVFALSDRGRDRNALVRVDLASGVETVIADDPIVDIQSAVIDPTSDRLLAAFATPGHQRAVLLEESVAAAVAPIRPAGPHRLGIVSASENGRRLLVSVTTERRGGELYLIDLDGAPARKLTESRIANLADDLADSQPISFPSRDGRLLHGYLTRPRGMENRPAPTVLMVHGGPWARDEWGYHALVQLLANRGYAVLRVNYRGSTGYGRAHRVAAMGEFARAMHADLLDGLTFAGSIGAADLSNVAIYGESYGGYAALVGLTMTPERFAAAIAVVGISDLPRFLETTPPYWRPGIQGWYLFVGDPGRPEQREEMLRRSPISFAADARAPSLLVHGANDVRVRAEQSERMAEALRRQGKATELLLFPDEGHGIRKRENRLRLYREYERFLAAHLGGRRGPTEVAEGRPPAGGGEDADPWLTGSHR